MPVLPGRARVTSDALYLSALRKMFQYQRRTPAEARELRRRRLPDGSYPLPEGTTPIRRAAA